MPILWLLDVTVLIGMFTRRLFLKGTVATMVATYLTGCNSSSSNNNDDKDNTHQDWKLVILPDTQKYSENSPERYLSQTQWIADNWKNERIPFTIHLGDLVEHDDQPIEWQAATQAMDILGASENTPYSVLCGNHDLAEGDKYDVNRKDSEPFLNYFSQDKLLSVTTCIAVSECGFNSCHLFKAPNSDQQFLVFAIDWNPSPQTFDWAQQVLDDYKEIPAIFSTHQLLNIDSDGKSPLITSKGFEFWIDFIHKNDQIFLTINGHHHGAANMVAQNAYGRDVLMMVVDYQAMYWGGNGMLRTIGFDYSNNKLVIRSFSPWVQNIPEDERTPFDLPDLTDECNQFEFPINFNERFTNLNEGEFITPPGLINGTVGYWLLDKENMMRVDNEGDITTMFQDLSGNGSHFKMEPRKANQDALNSYFEFSSSKPNSGNSSGSILLKGNKATDSGAYLSTLGTAITQNNWEQGYTIETFLQLPDDWESDRSRWGGIFCQQASCNDFTPNSGEDPAVVMAISSLREMQWVTMDNKKQDTTTAWSWDLGTSRWFHIAIINDGRFTKMYIDGIEVMRNPEQQSTGIAIKENANWLIGSSCSNGELHNPLYGYVSELRIVNRALTLNELLFNN
ncbi:hypothetical protein PMAL9190_01040 [Photobacterium malacitanum]|uniref:Calcineurin-like phosphoesterase domain-containing protein n=2 Tax=Photobacterium malacitanum TaxID=2204294 RepID=A0A1Y6MAP1_9GAMM|nr:hypothetical protein PMAL9190_01040 [Photobacterium malacitanum]